ncbi:hypothetical protein BSKO_03564 [Bryopsis sp. KO-2023]|nr:hypothetical protein BSKO_03564 [Bryopsis sp. KO-2023]
MKFESYDRRGGFFSPSVARARNFVSWITAPATVLTVWGLSRYLSQVLVGVSDVTLKNGVFDSGEGRLWLAGLLATTVICFGAVLQRGRRHGAGGLGKMTKAAVVSEKEARVVELRKQSGSNFCGEEEDLGVSGIGAHFGRSSDDSPTKCWAKERTNRESIDDGNAVGREGGGGGGIVGFDEESRKVTTETAEEWLLAPRAFTAEEKPLTVVLDLDGTLIMAKPSKELPADIREDINLGLLSSSKAMCVDGDQETEHTVVIRPGVIKFLEKVSAFAEVVVFTAGVQSYAEPLLDCLDPNNKIFSRRLFRHSTVKTKYQEYVKDLSMLGRDLKKTVLLDDRPFSGLLQPYNVIPCGAFIGDTRDHQLMLCYMPLLEHLCHVPDVRNVLKEIFRMHEYLTQWGVPAVYLEKCLNSASDTSHLRLQ